MTPDPKPARRHRDPQAEPFGGRLWASWQKCPLCLRSPVGLTRHHVVPRGQQGDDVAANLVWACGDGTTGCHGVLTHRGRDGITGLTFETVARRLLEHLRPEHREYAARCKYDGWLDFYYGAVDGGL